ncbi:MAG: family 16 glycoside hydrolase [Candidatus Eisenbacteria bacterium]
MHAGGRRTIGGVALACAALLAPPAWSGDEERQALPQPAPARGAPPANALFADDFSSGALERWCPDREGVWSVRRGMLRADLPDGRQERSFLHVGDDTWTDYALEFDVCMMRGVDKGAAVRVEGTTGVGLDLRGGSYQDVLLHVREWRLGRAPATNANGVWHHVRVEAHDTRWRVWVNGELVLTRRDGRRMRGHIAMAAYTGGDGRCTVYYDNVVVTPLH